MFYRPSVAPGMGAWIEIRIAFDIIKERAKSLPVWERGLKFQRIDIGLIVGMSLPVWERGLKFGDLLVISKGSVVAPGMGAWIEITLSASTRQIALSLPVWERGLKSLLSTQSSTGTNCRSRYGSVD